MLAVSICIANYNQDQFLKEALDSIAMQTYKDIEVKIYDDKEGVGSGEAFNRAIAMANAKIKAHQFSPEPRTLRIVSISVCGAAFHKFDKEGHTTTSHDDRTR
jgi:GT2 family glycosyltransferase